MNRNADGAKRDGSGACQPFRSRRAVSFVSSFHAADVVVEEGELDDEQIRIPDVCDAREYEAFERLGNTVVVVRNSPSACSFHVLWQFRAVFEFRFMRDGWGEGLVPSPRPI